MNRHGIVVPREDGTKARCMGPGPCPECNKDIADAPREVLLQGMTDYVAQAWSKNEPLLKLVTMVFTVGQISITGAVPENGPLTIAVPLVDSIPELQFMSALAKLADHFQEQLGLEGMARATSWLASRYMQQGPQE